MKHFSVWPSENIFRFLHVDELIGDSLAFPAHSPRNLLVCEFYNFLSFSGRNEFKVCGTSEMKYDSSVLDQSCA